MRGTRSKRHAAPRRRRRGPDCRRRRLQLGARRLRSLERRRVEGGTRARGRRLGGSRGPLRLERPHPRSLGDGLARHRSRGVRLVEPASSWLRRLQRARSTERKRRGRTPAFVHAQRERDERRLVVRGGRRLRPAVSTRGQARRLRRLSRRWPPRRPLPSPVIASAAQGVSESRYRCSSSRCEPTMKKWSPTLLNP